MIRILYRFKEPISPKSEKLTSFPLFFYSNKSQSLNSSTTHKTNKAQFQFSSICFKGIAESVISKCPQFFGESEGKVRNFRDNACLQGLLLDISDVVPDVSRRFYRSLRLEPEDVVRILVGFESESGRVGVVGEKVRSLWEVFRWAGAQGEGFRHVPQSCEVMASMLIRYGMFKDAQLLVLDMERQGISFGSGEILGRLVEGYASACDIERAVLMYDRMREQGFVPSAVCYHALIDISVKMKRARLAFRICVDMFEMQNNLTDGNISRFENIVKLLCGVGMVQEARNLVRQTMASGLDLSSPVLNEIACGYCDKKDFEDSLSCFVEMMCLPNVITGNKILRSLCDNFGVKRAEVFRLELERLGFNPDEITFQILIGWCCKVGDLRSAFFYLSDMLARGLKPDVWAYNSLLVGVFQGNIYKHAKDIADEMAERGITPNMTTFIILLAGYCKSRQFDEAKMVVQQMMNCGLMECSLEDPLSKAFAVLGLNPLSVRLKRDNMMGVSRMEFYDSLGNGLYLETELDGYEQTINDILKSSVIPDFNLLTKKECDRGNFKAALLVVTEMVRWGQELSPSVFSVLVKGTCASRSHIKACNNLVEKTPQLANQLDQDVLNLVVRAYCKKGFTDGARVIFNDMLHRNLRIENDTFTALIKRISRKGTLDDLHACWDISRNAKWMPGLVDCGSIFECLCLHGMINESLELFEEISSLHQQSTLEISDTFVEKLSISGFASIAQVLVEELQQHGSVFGSIAYSHLLLGLCREQKYSAAFLTLDAMLAKNLVPCPSVSCVLIPLLCDAGLVEKAIALRDVSREHPTVAFEFYRVLLDTYCRKEKIEKAATLFEDMTSMGLVPDSTIYDMLFQGHCLVKNSRKVWELLSVILRKCSNFSLLSYRNGVRFMCANNMVSYALNLKQLMLGKNCSIHNSLIIYNILIFHLFSYGNSFLVNEILSEMQKKNIALDETTYNFLLHGFFKRKDVSRALHYLSVMISKGFRPSNRNLRMLITWLCDCKNVIQALKLSQEMEMRGWVPGSVVQNAIVEGLLSNNMVREAEQFLDRMVDKGLIPRGISYDNLVKRFCSYQRLNKAIDLLNIMLKNRTVPNSTSYDSVTQGFCIRDLNQAMNFHAEMLCRDLKPHINTWHVLIQKLCEQRRPTEAEQLLIDMLRIGETPTKHMYSAVIERYRIENNLSKASEVMQLMQGSGYEPDFDTHWSLISNLSNSNETSGQGFLSRLLYGNGVSNYKDSKTKFV